MRIIFNRSESNFLIKYCSHKTLLAIHLKHIYIIFQVLSDLNKHMRTVHRTYRRKTKISQDHDQPDELSSASKLVEKAELTPGNPRINEVISSVSKPSIPTIAHVASNSKPNIPIVNTNCAKPHIPIVQNGQSVFQPNLVPIIQNGGSIFRANLAAKTHVDLVTSIKHELGLSSGITLQKIVKPSAPAKLPKLSYHGPKLQTSRFVPTQTFGSISLTPISGKQEKLQPRLKATGPMVEISSSGVLPAAGLRPGLTPPFISLRK